MRLNTSYLHPLDSKFVESGPQFVVEPYWIHSTGELTTTAPDVCIYVGHCFRIFRAEWIALSCAVLSLSCVYFGLVQARCHHLVDLVA